MNDSGEPGTRLSSVTGAVLCGGRSTRMGADKAVLTAAGKPMATWVGDAMVAAGIHPVVALGGRPPAGFRIIADEHPEGTGPLAAIIGGLRACGDLFVCPCDVPTISPAVVASILGAASASDRPVVLARTDRVEPLVGVYRLDALAGLEAGYERGARGPRGALDSDSYELVDVPREALRNVNTPEDLAVVEAALLDR